MKDRDVLFHKKWLGLAQPIEGLVFSVPVLADAQIAPDERADLSAAFNALFDEGSPRVRSLPVLLRDFLGYSRPGMLVSRDELPKEIAFYAAEGQQEIRPTYALARGPFANDDDPFATLADVPNPNEEAGSGAVETGSLEKASPQGQARSQKPWFALIWDLTESSADLDLDEPESATGPWRYPPTAKLERLLRHTGVPIGMLFNGKSLRIVYAPVSQATGHLTFRFEHMRGADGRSLLAAFDLLLHARRAYSASAEHTLEGLLAESRNRQADVTEELAKQVFEAVEILLAGFESAASRDLSGDALDWLRPALEAPKDHFYQGVLSVVLRLVFLLYAEDQALLPVEHSLYSEHLGLSALYARLSHDAGAHPESMHHRFGAYGQLLSLFRAVFFGVRHGTLELPPRRGRLFDPNTYPFLEGGLPGWTAAVIDAAARSEARPPSIDDGTIYKVMHRLVVFGGQRLSYRTLDVEQIGSVYESLMGYHVVRVESPSARLGKMGVWVESRATLAMSAADRGRYLKETCGLNPGPVQAIEKGAKDSGGDDKAFAECLFAHVSGRASEAHRHRADAGRLVLQPGEERRRTGSHYTPRALTEKVVKRTLEPLLACLGDKRTPEQILQLKICDPAMGSGAFLVAACRELADEIVSAWERRGEKERVIEQYGDAHLHARRLVAQQCLYGVDKNPAAVELAKLSLWLVTLSRKLPFTFVDHALRHGDSLVGLDFKQIEAFHWAPTGQVETARVLLKDALDQAVELRQQILALADHEDVVSQGEKRRLFDLSQLAIERVRIVADACVGAFFAEEKDAAREKERKRRLGLVENWIGGEKNAEDPRRTEEQRAKDLAGARKAEEELKGLASDAREKTAPFHWWIEFPEVFFEERPDPLDHDRMTGAALMEGVVGNPPFAGKNTLADSESDGYVAWLQSIHARAHGNSDLCAHFFRRAVTLLGAHGAFGLIATNTIAQGDTRTTGLASIIEDGWQIYDATDSMPWPGSAAVVVSLVHAARGNAVQAISARLNGRPVIAINSRLRPRPERSDPTSLRANADMCFQGCIVLGMGFTLSPSERDALVSQSSENALRIFPYLGGEEVNTSPTQEPNRFVINFGQADLSEASKWPDLIKIVREKVKPERDSQKDNADGLRRKQFWWQYGRLTPALDAALIPLQKCLITMRVKKHNAFCFVPASNVFANTIYVFPVENLTPFAVLQSRLHDRWTWLLSSTMKTDLNYSASDCFGNFPFPQPDPRTVIPSLESIGERLYTTRARYMLDTQQGLTKTYNALKDPGCEDPRVLELRRLHEDMDREVLAAYGWADIPVPPYCPMNDADREALQSFEDEVIDRLYVLNAARAREEAKQGLTSAKKSKQRPSPAADHPPNSMDPSGPTPTPKKPRTSTGEEGAPQELAAPGKTGKGKKPSGKQGKLFE